MTWRKVANVVNNMIIWEFQMSGWQNISPAWWEPPGLSYGFSIQSGLRVSQAKFDWGCDLISSTLTKAEIIVRRCAPERCDYWSGLWLQGCRKPPSRKYHLPPGSERKWWRIPPTAPTTTTTPSNALPLEHLPENQQPAELNGDTDTETTISKQAKNKTGKYNCWFFFFFFCHSQRKTNVLAAAEVTAQKKEKKENHLTSLLRFMSSGRTLTSQTGRRFCLLNQRGFLGGSGRSAPGTWETFFFGAPPDSAPSVGLKSQQLRLGLALLPASVTLQCQHSGSFTGDQPRLRG